MHISAWKEFPGYHEAGMHARIYFNGTLITHVVFADEDMGRVVQMALDERGRILPDYVNNRAKTVERYGIVCIAFPAELAELESQLREQQAMQRRNRK